MFGKRKGEEPATVAAKPQSPGPLPLIKAMEDTPPPATTEAGVEEARPAAAPLPPSPKELPMARSPFAPPPGPTTTPLPPRPVTSPMPSVPPRAETVERRTLVVGRGISVQGTVQDAERLVVEGTVEANSINGLTELSIAQGGVFKGEVEVEEAEIAGTIDGTLIARQTLIVRATGRVLGTARCKRLQVEDGGQITGRIEMLGEGTVRGED